MKKFMIITTALLFTNLTAKGQNLFLIGEKSYPCTDTITLESNADDGYDLNVFICKDGKAGLIGVSTNSIIGEEFTGELIILLKDGTVLTCDDSDASEAVDDRAIALYHLTDYQLTELKSSNIHMVKYTMAWLTAETYSVSNRGIETSTLISEFFKE